MQIFRLDSLDFAWPDGTACLTGIDLDVESGDFVLLKGPSGGGKSTLLRILARLERPTGGSLEYMGAPAGAVSPERYRREVCLIQQTPQVVAASVRENLLLPFTFRANQDMARPDDAALRRELDGLLLSGVSLDAGAKTLSVGQRQRLCLVRAMLLSPRVLLLDEPTSALDPESRGLVEAEAERLCSEKGITVIWVSHNDYVPAAVPPRILRIESCRLQEAS